MAAVRISRIISREGDSLKFRCPGCDDWHVVNIGDRKRQCWTWNGSFEHPTFLPSILVRTDAAIDPSIVWEKGDPPLICHSHVTDGRIQFLEDCTHALANQTVDLPEFERE